MEYNTTQTPFPEYLLDKFVEHIGRATVRNPHTKKYISACGATILNTFLVNTSEGRIPGVRAVIHLSDETPDEPCIRRFAYYPDEDEIIVMS